MISRPSPFSDITATRTQFKRIVFSFILTFTILTLMYRNFRSGVFAQDDPFALSYFQNPKTSIIEKIFQTEANRWRPIANVAYILIAFIVERSYATWLIISCLILASISTSVCYLYWKRGFSFWGGVALAILLATSRFSQGIVLNYAFILESLSLIILILLLLIFQKNWNQSKYVYQNRSLVLFAMLILSHERYVGMLLFIAVYFLFHREFENQLKINALSRYIVVVAVYFSFKLFFLEIPLLVGTGSTSEVGFSITTAMQFMIFLILGVLGINLAPEYLLGYVFQNQTNYFQGVSLLILILTMLMIIRWFKLRGLRISSSNKYPSKEFILGGSLFCSLAIPVISTIRLESRWYLPIYLLFIVYLFKNNEMKIDKSARRSLKVSLTSWLLAVFVILNLVMNFSYSQKMSGVYFVSTQTNTKIQLDSMRDIYKNLKQPNSVIYLVDPNNLVDLNYLLRTLETNTSLDRLDIRKVNSLEKILGDLSVATIIQIDEFKNDGSFRILDLDDLALSITGDW